MEGQNWWTVPCVLAISDLYTFDDILKHSWNGKFLLHGSMSIIDVMGIMYGRKGGLRITFRNKENTKGDIK